MPVVPTDGQAFYPVWKRLMQEALGHGMTYHDAEDLVSDSVTRAVEQFDGLRGDFGGFCYTILRNKIKNHWRDRKKIEEFDDSQHESTEPSPDDAIMRAEQEHYTKQRIASLAPKLTEDERQFLEMLGQVLEELEGRAVTEASRRLGIEPLKGHDILRRIQRKAKRSEEPPILRKIVDDQEQASPVKPVSVLYSLRETDIDELDNDSRLLASEYALTTSFDRFIGSLPPNIKTG